MVSLVAYPICTRYESVRLQIGLHVEHNFVVWELHKTQNGVSDDEHDSNFLSHAW